MIMLLLKGRQEIYTSVTDINFQTIPDIINDVMPFHRENSLQCEYLINYYRGKQSILERKKDVREDIKYNTVVNFANSIVKDSAGYFFSSPMQYTLRNTRVQGEFDEYKRLLVTEEKASQDFAVQLDASICGVGYMMAITNVEANVEDDAPFELVPLDPRYTCVVKESKVTHNPVLAFTYHTEETRELGINGIENVVKYTVYDVKTAEKRYIYRVIEPNQITVDDLVSEEIIGLPVIPIIQYKNNKFMLGEFEIVLDLLHGINLLASNSLEDIAQFVQSILVLINADIDEDNAAQLKKDKILSLVGAADGVQVDAKYIAAQLNPESIRNLRDSFTEMLMFITSTPDRRQAASGGDTGKAVFLGNGFPAQENNARVKSMSWYEAERDMIKLTLSILHKRGMCMALQSRDLQPVINRTLTETSQINALVQQMLLSSKLYAPLDIMQIAPMTNDTAQAATNGQLYWGDMWGGGSGETETETETDT